MLELFIANKNYSSWSLRPWLLLRQLEVPFTERLVPFAGGSSWAAFRAFSPTGRVPCLHDGDVIVWDSLAIVEYVAERRPEVWPADARARAWARSACAEMHAGFGALRSECSMSAGQRVRLHAPSAALDRDVARVDELWTDGLARWGGPFLAGARFTAVDAFFAPVVFRWRTYGFGLSAQAAAYGRRIFELPAMRDWHQAALAEPWRDEAHEREIRAAGDVVEDERAAP
ncbi:MAG TPA: glutathione S-transferase family protein [Kofleriaceae bacterium]|nr:glutathione S-transferase family protein [Kofleriaceae bacterium]